MEDDDSMESSSEGTILNGRNVGAAMHAPRDVNLGSPGGCKINIYVNSNIQGACTSALFGAKIKMRDPGVHLTIGDIRMKGNGGDDDDDVEGESRRRIEMKWIKVGLSLVCFFNLVLVVALILSSWSSRYRIGSS